jgi:hypothetical protein
VASQVRLRASDRCTPSPAAIRSVFAVTGRTLDRLNFRCHGCERRASADVLNSATIR